MYDTCMYHKFVFVTEIIFAIIAKIMPFCSGNPGEANLWVSLQKCVIPTALCCTDINHLLLRMERACLKWLLFIVGLLMSLLNV